MTLRLQLIKSQENTSILVYSGGTGAEIVLVMISFDRYVYVDVITAWLILNWGAHLALSRGKQDVGSGEVKSQWPRLADQFTYVFHALIIGWVVQWLWTVIPTFDSV